MNAVKLARVDDLCKAVSKIIIEISHHSLWKVNYRYPHPQQALYLCSDSHEYSLPEKHQNNRDSRNKKSRSKDAHYQDIRTKQDSQPIQLTFTLKMTTRQVVGTLVTVSNVRLPYLELQ